MLLTTRASANRPARRRSAFTLLEVLVVVAILVILATVATVATTKYIDESRKTKAQLGCVTLDKAIKAYVMSPQNPGVTDEEKLPTGPQDLVQPFGGSTSFLDNSAADLRDPWGKDYQFQRQNKPDGTVYILVTTQAPDGTQITQYGQGANAVPRFQ